MGHLPFLCHSLWRIACKKRSELHEMKSGSAIDSGRQSRYTLCQIDTKEK